MIKGKMASMLHDHDAWYYTGVLTANLLSYATDMANLAVAGLSVILVIYRLRIAIRKDQNQQKNKD